MGTLNANPPTAGKDGSPMWVSVEDQLPNPGRRVDLWLYIYASPLSMGMSDAFKVADAWRKGGEWWHIHKGRETRLEASYVTHWSTIPSPEEPPPSPTVTLW